MFEPFGPLYELSRAQARPAAPRPEANLRPFVPSTDLIVTEDEIAIVMDVPGLRSEDVSIEFEGDTITIRGERRPPFAAEDGARATPARVERAFGSFERTVRVPREIDADAIQGSLDHGVLTVRIPVASSREPRRVEVASGEQRERDTEPAPASAESAPA